MRLDKDHIRDLKDQVAPILTKIYTKSIETGIPKKFLVSQDVETDRKFLRNLNLNEISPCRLSTNVTMHVCVYAWIVTYVDSRQSPVYGPNSLSQNK
jgi:hypothetical protein